MLIHDERSLLALQGPEAAATLQGLVKEDLSKMYFSNFGRWGASRLCEPPCWQKAARRQSALQYCSAG